MAGDPAQRDALLALHAAGNVLLLKGRPAEELPREVLPCFKLFDRRPGRDDRRVLEGRGRARPRGEPPHRVRAVGHPHHRPRWRRASVAAPLPCWAGRSTTCWRSARQRQGGRPGRHAGDRRADPPRRPRGVDRPARADAAARPDAGLQAAALHQLAGLRPAGRDLVVRARDHDARPPQAQALARAAAGHRDQGRQPEAGDVRRRPPRPADGGARALGRRRGDAQRDVHLRRLLAARPHVQPALRRAAEDDPGARARRAGAGRATPGPTTRTSSWCARSRASRCSTFARRPSSCCSASARSTGRSCAPWPRRRSWSERGGAGRRPPALCVPLSG